MTLSYHDDKKPSLIKQQVMLFKKQRFRIVCFKLFEIIIAILFSNDTFLKKNLE